MSWLTLLAALTACGDEGEDVQNVAPPSTEESETAQIASIEGVDTSHFDASSQRTYARLINGVLSPCGEPLSLAACVQDEIGCGDCLFAARYIARLIDAGAPATRIREMVRARFDEDAQIEIDLGESPIRGESMAANPLTIVEFSDFQCPYCGRAVPEVERVLHRFAGRVRVVFKHFPLSGHEYAEPAARAAWAAGKQGKFWEMHDLLFAHQDALLPSDLVRYAQSLGLDIAQFNADRESDAARDAVEADKAYGRALGVQSTPSLFIDGRVFGQDSTMLEAYIAEELQRRGQP